MEDTICDRPYQPDPLLILTAFLPIGHACGYAALSAAS